MPEAETMPTETAENPFGTWDWNQIRRWATKRGIDTRGGRTRDEIEGDLLSLLAQNPDIQPEVEAPEPTKYLKVDQHTRDACRILDRNGHMLAMVYRLGREINGEREVLPMMENAEKVVAALRKRDD